MPPVSTPMRIEDIGTYGNSLRFSGCSEQPSRTNQGVYLKYLRAHYPQTAGIAFNLLNSGLNEMKPVGPPLWNSLVT